MIGQKNVALNYDQAIGKGSDKSYPSLELVRLDNIFLKAKKGFRVLEIGVGSGCNTLYLAKKGYDVTGIDIAKSSKVITEKKLQKNKINKKNFRIKILKYNYKKLPLESDYFDCVVCMSVLSLLGSKKKLKNYYLNSKGNEAKGKIILGY